MLNKYDLLSYFLSILINFFFFVIFFSSLNFNFRYNKEKKIKVKLISYETKSLSETLNLPAHKIKTSSNKLKLKKKSKFIPKSKSNSKPKSKNRPKLIKKRKKLLKKVKVEKIKKYEINERLIRKKIAKLEKKISSKKTTQEVQLSKQELQILKKKLLALQRIEKITERAETNNILGNNISEISKQKTKKQNSGKKVSKGTLQNRLSLDYLLLVKAKLQNHFEVPIYLRNKKDLHAIVSIDVSSKGEILHYTFLKNSSVPEFNQAVERCLKASSPLPVNKKAKIIVEFRSEGIEKLK